MINQGDKGKLNQGHLDRLVEAIVEWVSDSGDPGIKLCWNLELYVEGVQAAGSSGKLHWGHLSRPIVTLGPQSPRDKP